MTVLPISEDGFSASVVSEGRITARFIGSADLRQRPSLDRFLRDLHAEALRLAASEVVADFVQFDFLSSSGFMAFVNWITKLSSEPRSYRLKIIGNSKKYWQKRSLHTLVTLAKDVVQVEYVEG